MYDNCTAYTQSITSQYPDARVTSVNNVTVLVRGGPGTLNLPITNVVSGQQGAPLVGFYILGYRV